MKKKIFKAISIVAASGNAIAPAAAIPRTVTDPAEFVAYQTAIAGGSPLHIQEFLTKYPASSLLGTAFGQIMQQIQPKTLRESVGTAGILYCNTANLADREAAIIRPTRRRLSHRRPRSRLHKAALRKPSAPLIL